MKFRIFIFQVLHTLTTLACAGGFVFLTRFVEAKNFGAVIIVLLAAFGAYIIMDRIERSIYKYILKLKQKQKQIQSINELQRLTKL